MNRSLPVIIMMIVATIVLMSFFSFMEEQPLSPEPVVSAPVWTPENDEPEDEPYINQDSDEDTGCVIEADLDIDCGDFDIEVDEFIAGAAVGAVGTKLVDKNKKAKPYVAPVKKPQPIIKPAITKPAVSKPVTVVKKPAYVPPPPPPPKRNKPRRKR